MKICQIFSDHCQIIEHNVGNCRRITKHNIDQNKDEVEKKSNRQEHGQIYVIKEKPQQQPIHISSSSKDPSQQENEISTGGKKVSTTKGPVIEGDINHDVGSTKDQAEFLETQVNPHITLTITEEGQSSTESEFVDATSKMTEVESSEQGLSKAVQDPQTQKDVENDKYSRVNMTNIQDIQDPQTQKDVQERQADVEICAQFHPVMYKHQKKKARQAL